MSFQRAKREATTDNISNTGTAIYKAKEVSFEGRARMDDNGVNITNQMMEGMCKAYQQAYV